MLLRGNRFTTHQMTSLKDSLYDYHIGNDVNKSVLSE